MSREKDPGSLANLTSGDVLVSHPTAVREHVISIVPNAPHTTSPTHDAALDVGRSEAAAKGVDAWLTEDQTHVVKIASHRTPGKQAGDVPGVARKRPPLMLTLMLAMLGGLSGMLIFAGVRRWRRVGRGDVDGLGSMSM